MLDSTNYYDRIKDRQDDEDEAFERLLVSHEDAIHADIKLEITKPDEKHFAQIDAVTEEFAAVAKPALMAPVWAAYLAGDKATAGLRLVLLLDKAVESIAKESAEHSMRNRY